MQIELTAAELELLVQLLETHYEETGAFGDESEQRALPMQRELMQKLHTASGY